jgi:hypothetical protein
MAGNIRFDAIGVTQHTARALLQSAAHVKSAQQLSRNCGMFSLTTLHLKFEGMVVCGVEVSVFVMPHEVCRHLDRVLLTLLNQKEVSDVSTQRGSRSPGQNETRRSRRHQRRWRGMEGVPM